MRLRLVRTPSAAEPVVAVHHGDRWVPLSAVPGLEGDPMAAGGDLAGVLADPQGVLAAVAALPAEASAAVPAPVVTLEPALPLPVRGLRTFPLWQEEIEAVTATALHRFAGPLRRRALDLLGHERAEAVLHVVGAQWEHTPKGIRGNHLAVQSEGVPAPWPSFTQALDLELGLAAIISHPVHAGAAVRANDVVGGYALAVTVVARDVEHAELHAGRFGPSVSRDIATVLGSEVITPDELVHGRLGGLATTMRVGDELWSEGTTAGAEHTLDVVLTRAAQAGGLQPGEVVIATGVPGGTGAGLDRWVSPGDIVTFDVQRLGTVTVEVGQPAPHLHPGRLDRPAWTVVERRGHGPDVPAIDPKPWNPPADPPLAGPLAPDGALDGVDIWPTPGASKPEDVVVAPDGHVYAGVEDGRIFRWTADGGAGAVVADTHGRPLGIEVTASGDLVVCDADRGLLRIPVDGADVGTPEVLAGTHAGLAMKFTNNAAVAADGTVYFSDSSTRFGIHHYRLDLLEHGATGRIFAWRPGSRGALDLLASGLHFPNGVALAAGEDALLFVETSRYRLNRLWLTGPRAGEVEPLLEGMPGFPDNMSAAGDGTYWIALANRRNHQLDMALPHPAARRVITHIPERFQPQPTRYSIVLRVDADGRILQSLHGPEGDYAMVTGMRQHDGWLYLSSLVEPGIARVRLAG